MILIVKVALSKWTRGRHCTQLSSICSHKGVLIVHADPLIRPSATFSPAGEKGQARGGLLEGDREQKPGRANCRSAPPYGRQRLDYFHRFWYR